MAASGKFKPKNVSKYIGDISKITYRSSWELDFMVWLDSNPHILKWKSEPFPINYVKPTDGRVHRYFPDFYMEYRNTKGELIREVIEIKPRKESVYKQSAKLDTKVSVIINEAKWNAAVNFLHPRGIAFRVLTEASLFRKKQK